mmetsp:Transcript_46264/g.100581  ORF Transcript_46264/g.100581 Transcript_46264/m.100581 type:complete len:203 (+) Transcript_46264:62-670(+)|eukprot:CAMPEP_0170602166 /NCGR_PEP_ID=MMETSP0224-20130122/18247_1 /TAXON_ID=285029 /ORGANISM="Togula jolla, Strain CCCM 725" /LENGTH=202 /DNA_ID=CAMNT_0010926989 /DNA_START=62 /DNA_END=670 /DNA_ORIENTATION=+
MASPASASEATVPAALGRISQSEWAQKEVCYATLLKLLGNILANPSVDKYRHLKTTNATLQAKVFAVPGALEFLLAAGFVQADGESLEMPSGSSAADALTAAVASLRHQADEENMNELRRQRDERIVEERKKAAANDPFKCHASSHGQTDAEKQAIKEQFERDRAEFEADQKLHPTQDSKAKEGKFGATLGDTSYMKKSGGG